MERSLLVLGETGTAGHDRLFARPMPVDAAAGQEINVGQESHLVHLGDDLQRAARQVVRMGRDDDLAHAIGLSKLEQIARLGGGMGGGFEDDDVVIMQSHQDQFPPPWLVPGVSQVLGPAHLLSQAVEHDLLDLPAEIQHGHGGENLVVQVIVPNRCAVDETKATSTRNLIAERGNGQLEHFQGRRLPLAGTSDHNRRLRRFGH